VHITFSSGLRDSAVKIRKLCSYLVGSEVDTESREGTAGYHIVVRKVINMAAAPPPPRSINKQIVSTPLPKTDYGAVAILLARDAIWGLSGQGGFLRTA